MLSKMLKITVTSETKNLLQEEAARRGVSLSEVVRYILSEELNKRAAEGPVVQSGVKN